MSTENLKGALQKATKPTTFPQMVEAWKPQIALALPKHMNPDRVARIALTAFRQNPGLAECEPTSVFGAVIQSAQLGLEVGLMGEAHLVPFKKSTKRGGEWVSTSECTLIPGWQGLIKLAKNSGLVVDVYAHEVRANDKFLVTFGLERSLVHEPLMEHGFPASDEARGAVTGFYAVAKLKDGTKTFMAMPVSQVNGIRDRSGGYIAACTAADKYKKANKSPWVTDYVAMGLKTAVRALCKWLPKSPELAAALALDAAAEDGKVQGLTLNTNVIDGAWSVPDDETASDDDAPPETGKQDEAKKDAPPAKVEQESRPETEQAAPTGDPAAPTYADIAARINKATTPDEKMAALSDAEHLPADQKAELTRLALGTKAKKVSSMKME